MRKRFLAFVAVVVVAGGGAAVAQTKAPDQTRAPDGYTPPATVGYDLTRPPGRQEITETQPGNPSRPSRPPPRDEIPWGKVVHTPRGDWVPCVRTDGKGGVIRDVDGSVLMEIPADPLVAGACVGP